MTEKQMRVVICGGGVIAACTAYFLARRAVEVIVVERTGVACAASGKAGGFLALDWCAGSAVDALARRSFALHERLAKEIDGEWGYRRMNAYSGYVVATPTRGATHPAGSTGFTKAWSFPVGSVSRKPLRSFALASARQG